MKPADLHETLTKLLFEYPSGGPGKALYEAWIGEWSRYLSTVPVEAFAKGYRDYRGSRWGTRFPKIKRLLPFINKHYDPMTPVRSDNNAHTPSDHYNWEYAKMQACKGLAMIREPHSLGFTVRWLPFGFARKVGRWQYGGEFLDRYVDPRSDDLPDNFIREGQDLPF